MFLRALDSYILGWSRGTGLFKHFTECGQCWEAPIWSPLHTFISFCTNQSQWPGWHLRNRSSFQCTSDPHKGPRWWTLGEGFGPDRGLERTREFQVDSGEMEREGEQGGFWQLFSPPLVLIFLMVELCVFVLFFFVSPHPGEIIHTFFEESVFKSYI